MIIVFSLSLFPSPRVGGIDRQSPEPQCAQACVYRSCRLLGIIADIADITKYMTPKDSGNTLAEIRDTFKWIGLETRGRKVRYDELTRGPFPVIAHFQDHFVVVESADDTETRIYNGYGRGVTLSRRDFTSLWDGVALFIEPPAADVLLPKYAPLPEKGMPRVAFDTLIEDIGEADPAKCVQGATIDFAFTVRNRGNGPLEIKRVRADCSCAIGDLPGVPLSPGHAGEVVVTLLVGPKKGPFMHNAYVETNDPTFPLARLTIAGTTRTVIDVRPPTLDFGRSPRNRRIRKPMVLSCSGDQLPSVSLVGESQVPLKIAASALTYDAFPGLFALPKNLQPEARPPCNDLLVTVEMDTSSLVFGKQAGSMLLSTKIGKCPTIAVPYHVEIIPDLSASPSLVFLGDLGEKTKIESKVVLQSWDSSQFRIVSMDCDVPGLTCTFPEGFSDRLEMTVDFTPSDSVRSIESDIVVHYEGQTGEARGALTLSVYGYARPKA